MDRLYDELISDTGLRRATRKIFRDGHHAEAVRRAYVLVNNAVRTRCGSTKDGFDLMNHAFGTAAPALRLNALKGQSARHEQEG